MDKTRVQKASSFKGEEVRHAHMHGGDTDVYNRRTQSQLPFRRVRDGLSDENALLRLSRSAAVRKRRQDIQATV